MRLQHEGVEAAEAAAARPVGAGRVRPGLLAAVVLASALGGAGAGSHPTGTSVADPVLSGLLAGALAAAGAVASRGALVWAAVVAVGMSRRWVWVPSAMALAAAAAHVVPDRRRPVAGAVTAALVAQSMLRWAPGGFFGMPSLVAGGASILLFGSALRGSTLTTRRWAVAGMFGVLLVAGVAAAGVAVSLLESRSSLEAGMTSARAALKQMESYRTTSAVADLEVATTDLQRAESRLSAWWAVAGAAVPVVAQQQRAVSGAARAGRQLTAAALVAARTLQAHNLDAGGGAFDLASVRALSDPVQRVATALQRTSQAVGAGRSPWLVEPLASHMDRLSGELAGDVTTSGMVARGIRQAPVLLGADGPRNYLVAFMTPAEDRGLGGFIGAYALVTADRGRLTLVRSGRAPSLGAPAGSEPTIPGPAQYVDRYSAFRPQDHFQDLTYSPDFPTVEQVIAGLYPQMQGGENVDGVLVLDPYALQALLRFTGPISSPGFSDPLTASNAADVLLRRQYLGDTSSATDQARHDLLQEALTAGFQRLMSSSLPPPGALVSALAPLVRQGRLLFWDSRPAVQPLLTGAELDGSFPRPGPGSDVLAVTLSNYDNNKIDAYIHESVRDDVGYDPRTGAVKAQVAVTLRNTAPASGLPDYVIGSFPGSGIPAGTDEEWLTLYSPYYVESATFDGVPFPLGQPLPELGVRAYSGYVRIPAGSTGTLRMVLRGTIPAGSSYRMAVRTQPLANPVTTVVSVRPPVGWSRPPPWTLGSDAVQSRTWRLTRAIPGAP